MPAIFLVQCPRCGNRMNYQPLKGTLFSKSKKCVYCGKSFSVRERIIKRVS